MNKMIRAGAVVLAFTGMTAQPIAAFATNLPAPVANPGYAYGVAWGIGFFLCGGMAVGAQDYWAKKHHSVVTGKDRADAFIACILPPLGLALLEKHKPV